MGRLPNRSQNDCKVNPFVTGEILGRSANLWVGAVAAIYNLFVVFHLGGFDPTGEQNGAVNVAILALVILLANSRDNAIAQTKRIGGRRANDPPATSTSINPTNKP